MDTTNDDMRKRTLWLLVFTACCAVVAFTRLYLFDSGVITTPMLFKVAGLMAAFGILAAVMAGRANDEIGNKKQRGFEVIKNDEEE